MSHDHLIGASKKSVAKKMPSLIKGFDAYYKKNPGASAADAIAYMKSEKSKPPKGEYGLRPGWSIDFMEHMKKLRKK